MKSLNERKDSYFEEKAIFFKLLSSPIKLKILQFISFSPRTVEECAKKFNQSIQNMSLHLISLHKANILSVSKVKNFHFYSLDDGQYFDLVNSALALDQQSLLSEDLLFDCTLESLAKDIKSKKINLIDLRSHDEIAYIPLNGTFAFSDKLNAFPAFLSELPKSKMNVALCKGRLCERLAEAVLISNQNSFNVKGLPYSAKDLRNLQSLLI
ncbi:ArsR/SmtB family transcription factor [Peredibacter sp. HCB2-198]|uniref:ArsR/SmtB family transcription factor n=1 Tax=Peredibacter sp. HCB2-198 TaxID=3383025 RepID=UPI0038B46136